MTPPTDRTPAGRPTPLATGSGLPSQIALALDPEITECLRLIDDLFQPQPVVSGEPGTGMARVGRFELVRVIGRGGFGVVFLARDPRLDREVAVKVPRSDVPFTRELWRRFARESLAAGSLDHPNVVPVFEAGEDGAVPYIVSAYCPGPTLTDWLRDRTHLVPFGAAARLVAALADGVQHAHARGVLHRDLKPANVLLEVKPGTNDLLVHPRLTDFGLARRTGAVDDETRSFACLGTPGYMAPEQAAGRTRDVGPGADVYGLGAILYELLTGQPPVRGESDADTLRRLLTEDPPPPRRLRPGLPADLEAVCLTCLSKDPRGRYRTAGELADDLRRFARGVPTVARPPGWAARLVRTSRRNPWLSAAAGVVAVAVASAGAALTFNADRLASANRELGDANRRLQDETVRAVARERQLYRRVYADQVRHAAQLVEANDRRRAVEVLDGLRPGPGAEDLRSFSWHYLWGQVEAGGVALAGHNGDVHSATFSPDGARLATGGKDGTVRVWDVDGGKEVLCLRGHAGEVNGVSFSPDGRMLAAGGDEGKVCLWEAATGRLTRRLAGAGAATLDLQFSADNQLLGATGADGTVHTWDTRDGTHLRRLELGRFGRTAIGRDPGGRLLAIAQRGGLTLTYDAPTGGQRESVPASVPFVRTLAAAIDGTWTAAANDTGQVRFAARGKDPVDLRGPTGRVEAIAVNPERTLLACARRDSAVALFELESPDRPIMIRAHSGRVWGIAFSPDGRRLATAGGDGIVRLHDLRRLTTAGAPIRLPGPARAVAAVPGRPWVVTTGVSQPVQIWDLFARRSATAALPTSPRAGLGVVVTPDGRGAITIHESGSVARWSLPDLRFEGEWQLSPDDLCCLSAAADGRIATGDFAGRLYVGGPGRRPAGWDPGGDRVPQHGLALHPGGRVLAARGPGGAVVLWDAGRREVVGRLTGHRLPVNALTFSPGGDLLASASDDHTVCLWDWRSGQVLRTLAGHRAGVFALAFTPDGRELATGGDDRTVRLWRVETGDEVLTFPEHPDRVCAITFADGGRALVTVGGGSGGPGFLTVREAGPSSE